MNVFGFFAVIIACITLCIITMIVCKKGLTITKRWEDNTKDAPETKNPMGFTPSLPTVNENIEKEINEQTVAKASMDAVIKAANELMGIQTEEVKDDGKE